MSDISSLIGKTISKISSDDAVIEGECDDGSRFRMIHEQDCCESVYIESIEGDLQSLVGHQILVAEERECDMTAMNEYDESYTWTFYVLATIKGHVDIRWYGSSNGYYSERVDFQWLNVQNQAHWRGGWE